MVSQKYKKAFVVWWIGFSILVVGIVFVASYQAIFRAILSVKLPLTKDSISFPLWRDVPVPLYLRANFFNITNPDEIFNKKAVPVLEEIGPYSFRAYFSKESIVFNSNNTVTFREIIKYIFLPDESIGELTDVITTINTPMIAAAYMLKDRPPWMRWGLSLLLKLFKEKFIIEKSVRELLFDGYYDPIYELAPLFNPKVPNTKGYFGFLYGKNDTDDGIFVSYTGEDDLSKFNVIDRWNGERNLPFWKDNCSMINGSNAEVNPPLVKGQTTLSFFRTILCRTWTLQYESTFDHFGLDAHHFAATPMVLANSSVNPDNYCFEPEGQVVSGIGDIGPCQYGSPVFLSQPHFFQGDPVLRDQVHGLSPNESLHQFTVDVEPISGISLSLGARFQINIHLQEISGISQFKNVPDLFIPALWLELAGDLPEDETAKLKHELTFAPFLMSLLSYIFIGIGGLIAIAAIGLALFIYSRNTTQTSENSIDNEEEKQEIIPNIEEEN